MTVIYLVSDQSSNILQTLPASSVSAAGNSITPAKDFFGFFSTQSIDILISPENICCGYSLEAPRRGTSNEYPLHMFSWKNKINIIWILAPI